MKKNNLSSDQLSKSLERRTKHLMIQALGRFEDSFPDLDNTKEGQIFKTDLRNAFNDVIRATRDEIRDYYIEYRPLRLENNILTMTNTFMRTVQKISFGFNDDLPYIKIYTDINNGEILDAIRAEFGTGVLSIDNNSLVLEIFGLQSLIDTVLPIMDKYHLHENVKKEYKIWREKVVDFYRS